MIGGGGYRGVFLIRAWEWCDNGDNGDNGGRHNRVGWHQRLRTRSGRGGARLRSRMQLRML
jgi:hypothetical protein